MAINGKHLENLKAVVNCAAAIEMVVLYDDDRCWKEIWGTFSDVGRFHLIAIGPKMRRRTKRKRK